MADTFALVFGAVALLLLAGAVLLLGRAGQQTRRRQTDARLDRGMEPRMFAPGGAAAGAFNAGDYDPSAYARQQESTAWRRWLMGRRGGALWDISTKVMLIVLLSVLVISLIGWFTAGPFGLVFALLLGLGLNAVVLWQRAQKKRRRVVMQLPGFLDNMVRLISIGNSPHAAFQLALSGLDEPIRTCLEQAGSMLRAGKELDNAVAQSGHSYDVEELDLVAAVLRMSVRYGGRADVVLERVADYIRDRESAEQELHALSAETRLSAWILALLPIGVGAMIIFLNGAYFQRMWEDGTGRMLILASAVLEALGAFILYRLARLR